MTTDKLIQKAVELGFLNSADEYYKRDAYIRELIIKRLGRQMTKRFGQGWSR